MDEEDGRDGEERCGAADGDGEDDGVGECYHGGCRAAFCARQAELRDVRPGHGVVVVLGEHHRRCDDEAYERHWSVMAAWAQVTIVGQ